MIKPYSRRVFYYETDKMNIMNHSNYIHIFEESRVDFLRQSGMPFETIENRGILMPTLSVECRYKCPLRFDDPFEVRMKITRFNGVSMNVEYTVTNPETGSICAEGASAHCFTDSALNPIRIKKTQPDIYKIFYDYMKTSSE